MAVFVLSPFLSERISTILVSYPILDTISFCVKVKIPAMFTKPFSSAVAVNFKSSL